MQRTAIVTGAARGIGAAVARRLAGDGMAVGMIDLDEADCADTVEAITSVGGTALAVAADVADEAAVTAAVTRIAVEFGPPTVLVNKAGIGPRTDLAEMSTQQWETVLGINLSGPFFAARAVCPHMVTAGLLRTEPDLRRSCFYQATIFAGFSTVWTCLALLLAEPAYGLNAQAVGMIALVGAATMVCTPFAGRLVDRYGPDPVNLVCMLGVLVSAAILTIGARGGALGLAALTLGTLLLDTAMQSGMVANQVRVYACAPTPAAGSTPPT
ncbi:SDR family NAD(P)-dependent oxidoreductase [Streptomyces viridiviolaceus]